MPYAGGSDEETGEIRIPVYRTGRMRQTADLLMDSLVLRITGNIRMNYGNDIYHSQYQGGVSHVKDEPSVFCS